MGEPAELKFYAREYMGVEALHLQTREPLTRLEDLVGGAPFWVHSLVRGYGWIMRLREFDPEKRTGYAYTEDGKTSGHLAFDQDDRHCWVCTCVANLEGLQRVNFT